MKKPTARISTEYAPMLHPFLAANAAMHVLSRQPARWWWCSFNDSAAPWQDDKPTRIPSHGFEARDRQQELFVVVDAAVAGAESQQHCLRGSVHPALYRRRRQGADFEFHAFGQGAGADRWRRHDRGFALHHRIRRRTVSASAAVR